MARRLFLLAVALVLTAGLGPRLTAEQGQSVTVARAAAEKSFRAGRYAEIDTVAQAFPKDEQIAVYRALGVAARGDYAAAESILQAFATVSPGGEAALELGLLQLYEGKRTEGRRTLTLLLTAEGANPTAA